MSNTLVHILPPLRQSMVETAACPRAYVEIYINGKVQPESIPSERGTEIHRIMAQYVKHCSALGIVADWHYFNKLAIAAGPDAGPILDGIRDVYEVDHQHVYGTEITLALDEEFRPAYKVLGEKGEIELPRMGGVQYSEELAAHIGTLDVVLLNDECTRAKIDDYKSHPAPFDPDTYQGTLYPFMLMRHYPALEKVTFELNFVRYRNCTRVVSWKRSDMPEMAAAISRARERQRLTHANPDEAKALPSSVCVYCPLTKKIECPIAEWNERMTLTPQQRLIWKVWMTQMNKINNPLLKDWTVVHGPVRYQDGNGNIYEYGEMPVPQTRYPLDQSSLTILNEWAAATGENLLDGRLNISSTKLKGYLKAQKREALRERFEESCIEKATKPKYAVRTPEGIEEDYNPYAQED